MSTWPPPPLTLYNILRYNISATSVRSDTPLGQMAWEVSGDAPCSGAALALVQLNINACDDSEFNCNDGHCVGIDQRCDGRIDCPDKTGKYSALPPPPPPLADRVAM